VSSSAEDIVRDWLRRIELIEDDVQELLARRQVFQRLGEIVRANPKLNRPSYLYEYLQATYGISAAVGVRRHARSDRPELDASLLGLLYSIRRTPELLSRERHVCLYAEQGMPVEVGSKEFDRLAGVGVPYLEKRHVQPDIDRFLVASEEVEKYVTTRIAHLDKDPPKTIPNYADLDHALVTVEQIVERYTNLLQGRSGTINPTIVDNWERVLKEVWIPPQ
jgi:hypothetical protein